MKYILFRDQFGGIRIRLFLAPETHKEMALSGVPASWRVISAGYYDPVLKQAFGGSDSLGISSRPEDERLINAFVEATLRGCPWRPESRPS